MLAGLAALIIAQASLVLPLVGVGTNGYHLPVCASSKSILVVVLVILAFAAGFGLATLREHSGLTASAASQAALYRQVLTDLQRDYYKPIDAAQLGQSGITGLLGLAARPLHRLLHAPAGQGLQQRAEWHLHRDRRGSRLEDGASR